VTERFYISPAFSTVRPEDFPTLDTPGIVYKRKPTGWRTYRARMAPPREKKPKPPPE
jgi:hypothetical protein